MPKLQCGINHKSCNNMILTVLVDKVFHGMVCSIITNSFRTLQTHIMISDINMRLLVLIPYAVSYH